VLLTDGYAAYDAYSQRTGTSHALCWAHTRRKFYEAQDADPEAVRHALAAIAGLYAIEQQKRGHKNGVHKNGVRFT